MKILDLNVKDLIPYENNPRINNNAVDKVAESIKQFGFKVPIIIDKNNVIVAGHTRHKAAKKLKLKTVPCVIADDLTDKQIKALRLADNKVAEFAEWDFSLLEQELAELDDWDMGDFGFEEAERDFDHIADLLESGFGTDEYAATADTFGMTFNFPIEKRTEIESWVKAKTKDYVVDMIIAEVENGN